MAVTLFSFVSLLLFSALLLPSSIHCKKIEYCDIKGDYDVKVKGVDISPNPVIRREEERKREEEERDRDRERDREDERDRTRDRERQSRRDRDRYRERDQSRDREAGSSSKGLFTREEVEQMLQKVRDDSRVKKGTNPPYPAWMDEEPFPPKLKQPNLQSYDGKGSPQQHLCHFK